MRGRAVAAAREAGLRAEVPESAAFVWAAIDGDAEEEASEGLAREYRIPAVCGRHIGARTPHLRIPFGGRPEAREALLESFASLAARRPAAHQ
jgi:histidinol-phosphate/aromatic aminotransferase/cobyric acid decarboxylase-like protein